MKLIREIVKSYRKWKDQKVFYKQVNAVKYLPYQILKIKIDKNTYEFYSGVGIPKKGDYNRNNNNRNDPFEYNTNNNNMYEEQEGEFFKE